MSKTAVSSIPSHLMDSPACMADSGLRCVGLLLRRVDCNDGVSSHCETLIRGLHDAGIKIVLLTGDVNWDDSTRARYEALLSLATVWIRLPIPTGRMPVNWRASKQIAAAIGQHNIDILHLHGVALLPLAQIACLSSQVPLVVTAHPSGTGARQPTGVVKAAMRVVRPLLRKWLLPDRAIAISSELHEWFISDVGMHPDNVELIYHGVDVKHYRIPTEAEKRNARETLRCSPSEFVCGIVGRLDPVKRHDVLLDALRELAKTSSNVRLLIAGGGTDGPIINEMVRIRGLEKVVTFCGYISDPREVYWASDAFVLPSDREGFGLVTAEAMLCGAIPLRTPTAGARDQIDHGKTGFIFPFGDSASLAANLRTICSDCELASRISKSAVIAARKKFDSDLMIRSTIGLYSTLAPFGK